MVGRKVSEEIGQKESEESRRGSKEKRYLPLVWVLPLWFLRRLLGLLRRLCHLVFDFS